MAGRLVVGPEALQDAKRLGVHEIRRGNQEREQRPTTCVRNAPKVCYLDNGHEFCMLRRLNSVFSVREIPR